MHIDNIGKSYYYYLSGGVGGGQNRGQLIYPDLEKE